MLSNPKEVTLKPAHQHALVNFDKLPDTAGVPAQVVAALLAVTVPTVWRRTANLKLPQPIRNGGLTRWNVGTLRKALNGRGE